MWGEKHPELAGYYWAIPRDPRQWTDGAAPEPVHVYFDGKWCVFRTGETMAVQFDFFSHWGPPIDYLKPHPREAEE
jgi:hypothetical protein